MNGIKLTITSRFIDSEHGNEAKCISISEIVFNSSLYDASVFVELSAEGIIQGHGTFCYFISNFVWNCIYTTNHFPYSPLDKCPGIVPVEERFHLPLSQHHFSFDGMRSAEHRPLAFWEDSSLTSSHNYEFKTLSPRQRNRSIGYFFVNIYICYLFLLVIVNFTFWFV